MQAESRGRWLVSGLILLFGLTACAVQPSSARLAAKRERVKVRRQTEVSHTEMAVPSQKVVNTGDEIKLEEQGWAELRFPDALRIDLELLGGTKLRVDYLPPPNQDPVARLFLASGTTWQDLQGEVARRVVQTETPSAVVIAQGTEYLVSVDDSQTTWVVGFEGHVAVEGQNQQVVVAVGQATWVRPGQPPQPPVPVDLGAVGRWLDGLRAGELTPIEPVILTPTPTQPPTVPSPEVTDTPIPSVTPTGTLPPSPMFTPSATPSASPSPTTTATPVPACEVVNPRLNLRRGPGLVYPVISTLRQGEVVDPQGRTADASWLEVRAPSTTIGWVSSSAQFIRCTLPLDQIPVESQIPPTPTFTPTPTPTWTSTPTPTPEPSINCRADQTELKAGECTTLHWDMEHIIAVYLDGKGVVGDDSGRVCPKTTQTFTWRVVTAAGDQYCRVTINVQPSGPALSDFVGDWYNVDSNTRSITRILISQEGTSAYVHAYGKCHPIDCDWGTVGAQLSGSSLIAGYKFSFKVTRMTMTLSGNRLRVFSTNRFTDGSNRDYDSTDYFYRSSPID
jgi:hypothetical protein